MVLNFRRVSPAEECEGSILYNSGHSGSQRAVFGTVNGPPLKRFWTYVETRFKSLAAGTPGDKPRAPAAATKSRSPRSHSRGVSMLLTRVARRLPAPQTGKIIVNRR